VASEGMISCIFQLLVNQVSTTIDSSIDTRSTDLTDRFLLLIGFVLVLVS